MQAKHDSFQSLKSLVAIEQRVNFLQKRDEQMMQRLENEKKRADDMNQVREEHREKVRQLKQASIERQMKMSIDAENNLKNKHLSKQSK